MSVHGVLKWTAVLLVGPFVGVAGAVMYEHDIAKDAAGLLAESVG